MKLVLTTINFDVITHVNSIQFEMPDFVIILFQTNRDADCQQKDSSLCDYFEVKNIYFEKNVEMKHFLERILIAILLLMFFLNYLKVSACSN